MITVVIIDDEPLARSIVKEYLASHENINLVAECSDGFEGIKAIQQFHPDLIFLDIQMPKINGFEMLELLDKPPAVIFTTAFDEFALKAFETHAVDYLLKPFSKERFDKAIARATDLNVVQLQKEQTEKLLQQPTLAPQAERVVVKVNGKINIIPVHSIEYLEAADDYVKIHTANGTFLKNKTMSFFENTLLKEDFVRTHRSFIVNVKEVSKIEPYEKENHLAILRRGMKVPVSQSGYTKLKAVLGL